MGQNQSTTQSPPGSWLAKCRKTIQTYVLIILAFHLKGPWNELVTRPKQMLDFPSRKGEVAVITGGARGIGFEVIRRLLLCNFYVIMGVRSTKSGEEAVEKLREDGISNGTVIVLPLDLKSLDSVRSFAQNVLEKVSRIDLMINNAGVMLTPYEVTEDGFESAFQVNYLSHFLLTQLLLPQIKETGKRRKTCCRIINVSSDFYVAGRIDFEDLGKCKVFSSSKSYADSKLCQVLQTVFMNNKLEEENANVKIYAVHPGMIPSNLWINVPSWFNTLISAFRFLLKKVEHGADVVVFAAISNDVENFGGSYIRDSKIVTTENIVNNKSLQAELWKISAQLVKLQLEPENKIACP